jgi:hypothetical protein
VTVDSSAVTSIPRPASSLACFWGIAVIAVLLLGDALLSRDWAFLALAVAPTGLVVIAAWILFYRPAIRFGAGGLTVHNPGTVIEIPWARLTSVGQRLQVILYLDDGRRISCWGSPNPVRPGFHRGSRGRIKGYDGEGRISARITSARDAVGHGSSDTVVRRRPDVVPLVILAVLIVACAVEVFAH